MVKSALVYLEAPIKMLKRLCRFCVSDFQMTWCDCSSAVSSRSQQKIIFT